MKAQITIEFLIVSAGLLAVYALLLPSLINSFENANEHFNKNTIKAIEGQITWKAGEVDLLEPGSMLKSEVNSPVEFTIESYGVEIKKGRNELLFVKTIAGVEIHSK